MKIVVLVFILVITSAFLLLTSGARADAADEKAETMATAVTPKQIVINLYAPYLGGPQTQKNQPSDALDAIYAYASSSLKQAIDKDRDCQTREQGVCNADSDIIINAQDWHLSNLKIKEEKRARNSIVIRAAFINGDRNIVRYFFIQEHGEWQIDDVEATRLKENNQRDFQYKLKQTLLR